MTDVHDVIAAFADGEPVDRNGLRDALADPAGREYLIDVLALRALIGSQPIGDVAAATTGRTGPSRVARFAAAAALAGVCIAGGYFVGQRVNDTRFAEPPTTAGTVATSTAPVLAPAPTHVIRLEPGVDWTERKGGN